MARIHQGPVCAEGNVEKCSKGRGSCPSGHFGGWLCSGCIYDTEDDKRAGRIAECAKIANDKALQKLRSDLQKMQDALKKNSGDSSKILFR